MKKEFIKNWKSSKQPRKQRKYLANAPISIKKKFLSVNLSKELREKYKKRNIPARKGDTVKIMRGKFKGKKEKIIQADVKKSKITIENIQVKKRDGSNANIKFQPSNLQITELNLEDKKRVKKLTKSNEKINEEKSK